VVDTPTIREEIFRLVAELGSSDRTRRSTAKKRLLVVAATSDEARTAVIMALIAVLQGARREQDPVPSTTWYAAADLVGRLKASEAIDVLIEHLDYNDGTVGLSLGHFPAMRAVVQIGNPTVPGLVTALSQGRRLVRINAARSLGLIGGAPARQALEDALKVERQQSVVHSIRQALLYLSRDR
jgi:HEAT repeat protein